MQILDEPLATYEERRFPGKRLFRLYGSYVEVAASTATLRFELSHLLPTPRTGSVIDATTRRRLWIANFTMLALWFVVPALLPEVSALLRQSLAPLSLLLARLGYLAAMLLLATLALLWRRRFEFAEFEYEPGKPAFDLLNTSSREAGFQAFVDAVSRRIAATRQPAATDDRQDAPS